MERFAFQRTGKNPYSCERDWRQLILVEAQRTITLDMTPALLLGSWRGSWRVDRVKASDPDDWKGMTAADIAAWIRTNWDDGLTEEITPALWDETFHRYQERLKEAL